MSDAEGHDGENQERDHQANLRRAGVPARSTEAAREFAAHGQTRCSTRPELESEGNVTSRAYSAPEASTGTPRCTIRSIACSMGIRTVPVSRFTQPKLWSR